MYLSSSNSISGCGFTLRRSFYLELWHILLHVADTQKPRDACGNQHRRRYVKGDAPREERDVESAQPVGDKRTRRRRGTHDDNAFADILFVQVFGLQFDEAAPQHRLHNAVPLRSHSHFIADTDGTNGIQKLATAASASNPKINRRELYI